MTEALLGIILGSFISWFIAYWYYKKQEKTNPTPLIKDISIKLQELYDLANERNDKKLKSLVKNLSNSMSKTYSKILTILLPLAIDTQGLSKSYSSGNIKEFDSYLKEVLPSIFKFSNNLKGVTDEFRNLIKEVNNFDISDEKNKNSLTKQNKYEA